MNGTRRQMITTSQLKNKNCGPPKEPASTTSGSMRISSCSLNYLTLNRLDQLRKAVKDREQLLQKSNEEYDEQLDEAIHTYSRSVCRPFDDAVHAALPWGLRNIVYSHLLSFPEEERQLPDMKIDLEWNLLYSPHDPRDGFEPYFIRYTGAGTRAEIFELMYRRHYATYECDRISVLRHLVNRNRRHRLIPLHFIRELTIRWEAQRSREPLRDPKFFRNDETAGLPSSKYCFEKFLTVPEKDRFTFTLRISFSNLSLKHLGHLLESFRPVYTSLVAAGSKIRIVYRFHTVEFDLTDYYSKPADLWRADLRRGINEGLGGIPERAKFCWDDEGDELFDRVVDEIDYLADEADESPSETEELADETEESADEKVDWDPRDIKR
ncbi:hypothetical protein BDV95DRAFT_616118 [Massariosphaeria phaeospora]|uniref:Uncharacterized protein n=1 Tax=Massariosphaeria phaeospora TaxID=100035 RepID=A0A7C8II90_9PLEO|nr:hypothetical protein BDV95DRAFT_616118 [Massariosphaeria phaeospora]